MQFTMILEQNQEQRKFRQFQDCKGRVSITYKIFFKREPLQTLEKEKKISTQRINLQNLSYQETALEGKISGIPKLFR